MISILVGCVFIYRIFCRFLCPLGALYGLFNRFCFVGVEVNADKCTQCGLCVKACKVDIRHVGDRECIQCGECVGVCPTQAIHWKGRKPSAPTKKKRIALVVVLAAVLGCMHRLHRTAWKAVLKIAGCGILLALHWVAFFASIQASNVSIGVACVATSCFFTTLFDPLVNRRRIQWKNILLSFIAIAGILFIFSIDVRFRLGHGLGCVCHCNPSISICSAFSFFAYVSISVVALL